MARRPQVGPIVRAALDARDQMVHGFRYFPAVRARRAVEVLDPLQHFRRVDLATSQFPTSPVVEPRLPPVLRPPFAVLEVRLFSVLLLVLRPITLGGLVLLGIPLPPDLAVLPYPLRVFLSEPTGAFTDLATLPFVVIPVSFFLPCLALVATALVVDVSSGVSMSVLHSLGHRVTVPYSTELLQEHSTDTDITAGQPYEFVPIDELLSTRLPAAARNSP